MLLEESSVCMVQSRVRKQETDQKHTRVHWDYCEASQPPALVAESRLSVQRGYMVAHKPRVRNRTPLGRCKTSCEGASTTRDCLSEKAVGYSGA